MYEYWFAGVKNISTKKKRRLRQIYKNAEEIYNIEEIDLKKIEFLNEKERNAIILSKLAYDMEQAYHGLCQTGIQFIPYFSEKYPERLKKLIDPPYALFCRGSLPKEEKRSVAIVGARKCTAYGENQALKYGEVLAKAGVQIISGMARGIDGAAQRGALNGEGHTYGVLGCGVDICYPREHKGLYQDIQNKGGLLSEQLPGVPPYAQNFPARNRIISGLADMILVIEAQEKSGSLITADIALDQGKDVYALPGPVTSPMSQGCHRLIAQGAGILISPQELLEEMNISPQELAMQSDENKKMLETTENMLYSCLDLFPKGIQELLDKTKMAPEKLLQELISLQLEGKIKEISKNYYVRT